MIISILYGCRLRVSEALGLRVKDPDFEYRQVILRNGKGANAAQSPLNDPRGVRRTTAGWTSGLLPAPCRSNLLQETKHQLVYLLRLFLLCPVPGTFNKMYACHLCA